MALEDAPAESETVANALARFELAGAVPPDAYPHDASADDDLYDRVSWDETVRAEGEAVAVLQALRITWGAVRDNDTLVRWAEAKLRHVYADLSRTVRSAGYFLIGDPYRAPRTSLAAECPFLCVVTPVHLGAASYDDGVNMLMLAEALELRFLCGYDLQPVEPPVVVHNPGSFVVDIAPALALSLSVLEAAVASGWLRGTEGRLASLVPTREGGTLLDGLATLRKQVDAALAASVGTHDFAPQLRAQLEALEAPTAGASPAGLEAVVGRTSAAFEAVAREASSQGVLKQLPMLPQMADDGTLTWVSESMLRDWRRLACPARHARPPPPLPPSVARPASRAAKPSWLVALAELARGFNANREQTVTACIECFASDEVRAPAAAVVVARPRVHACSLPREPRLRCSCAARPRPEYNLR